MSTIPVSYTHLDVYKRQPEYTSPFPKYKVPLPWILLFSKFPEYLAPEGYLKVPNPFIQLPSIHWVNVVVWINDISNKQVYIRKTEVLVI